MSSIPIAEDSISRSTYHHERMTGAAFQKLALSFEGTTARPHFGACKAVM